MFSQGFVVHALLAGTGIALASGALGWFVALRAQVFAGDALSHVGFSGAVAAAAAGIDLRLGLFAATIGVALVFAGLGRRAQADDVTIGVTFAWVLGLGVFCLDRFGRNSGDGSLAARTLFGSIFGLGRTQSLLAVALGCAVALGVALLARPLLFATIDPEGARVRGVPVAVVGAGFLVLLGVDAAEATQAVGALLLLGLIVVPGGAALRLTSMPIAGLALSTGIAVVSVWGGITLAYVIPSLPPSSAIVGVAVAIYALSWLPRRAGT